MTLDRRSSACRTAVWLATKLSGDNFGPGVGATRTRNPPVPSGSSSTPRSASVTETAWSSMVGQHGFKRKFRACKKHGRFQQEVEFAQAARNRLGLRLVSGYTLDAVKDVFN